MNARHRSHMRLLLNRVIFCFAFLRRLLFTPPHLTFIPILSNIQAALSIIILAGKQVRRVFIQLLGTVLLISPGCLLLLPVAIRS